MHMKLVPEQTALNNSELLAETVAVFAMLPAVPGAVVTMSKAAVAPLAREDAVQVTVPLLSAQPVSAETKTTPVGSGSEMVTLVAASGPLLVAVRV